MSGPALHQTAREGLVWFDVPFPLQPHLPTLVFGSDKLVSVGGWFETWEGWQESRLGWHGSLKRSAELRITPYGLSRLEKAVGPVLADWRPDSAQYFRMEDSGEEVQHTPRDFWVKGVLVVAFKGRPNFTFTLYHEGQPLSFAMRPMRAFFLSGGAFHLTFSLSGIGDGVIYRVASPARVLQATEGQ